MSVEEMVDEPESDSEVPVEKPKPGKKKLIIIAAGAAAILIGGGGGAYAVFGGHGTEAAKAGTEEKGAHADAEGKEGESFIDVPAMVVNLRGADGTPHFLKVHFMLVPGPTANGEELKKKIPLLLDAYQPFLRELRPEDLAGSAAVFRIKEEMLVRATAALGADQVKDVLIQDLVQQ